MKNGGFNGFALLVRFLIENCRGWGCRVVEDAMRYLGFPGFYENREEKESVIALIRKRTSNGSF